MPRAVVEFQDTPNPNALKCVLAAPPPHAASTPTRSFRSPADAASDPIAQRLFEIPGIIHLLIHPAWITVNKAPDAAWKPIKAAVERALAQAP